MAEDIRNMESTLGNPAFEKQFQAPRCILLDSEYCSMGRMIGMLACKQAGYRYYDAVTLLELVPETGITMDDVDAFELQLRRKLAKEEILSVPDYQRISAAFDTAIDRALEGGPCLIHDHATQEMIAAKGYTSLRVLTYATSMADKMIRARLSPVYKAVNSDEELVQKIQEEDFIRINYHAAHSETVWGQKSSYDLCLNTDALGRDYAAFLLGTVMSNSAR